MQFLCVFYVTIWGQKLVLKNRTPGFKWSRYGKWKVTSLRAMSKPPSISLYLNLESIQGHSASSSIVVVAIYTSEINQPEIRKLTGVFPVICISFGDSLTMVFGKFHFKKIHTYLNNWEIKKKFIVHLSQKTTINTKYVLVCSRYGTLFCFFGYPNNSSFSRQEAESHSTVNITIAEGGV